MDFILFITASNIISPLLQAAGSEQLGVFAP
jgi:hypothetical protein